MKTSLENETGMDRAVHALLDTGAAAVTTKMLNPLRPGESPAPRSQRAALVKGGVRHG